MIAWEQITAINAAVQQLNLSPVQSRKVAYFARLSLRDGDDDDVALAVHKAFERICGEWGRPNG